jgi:UDPglucose--hexose-1-phosphate uridylyltransferase
VRDELESCPFCEGREDRTPPETLALGRADGDPDTPGWRVRVVPNLYPALARQEVVIHTPEHRRSIAELDDEQLGLVAEAWQRRAHDVTGLAYLHALVNEGREAGSSLPHTHSQLAWFSEVPPVPTGERELDRLLDGEAILERSGLVLLCPRASRLPYEMLIAPAEPEAHAFDSELLGPALALTAEGIRRLRRLEPDAPLNLWVHDVPWWHVELLPRLTVLAGIELGAGVHINGLPPEDAAAALRNS